VGVDRFPATPVDLGGFELPIRLCPEQLAELAVVEGGEGPGELVAGGAAGGVKDQLAELLPLGALEAHGLEPGGGNAAGRGLALADLVAGEHEARGPRACHLP